MRIYLPNTSRQSIGGGWTFRQNLMMGLDKDCQISFSFEECDIVLITGATMVSRDEIIQAKNAGKKIIFRIDNIPKDSRNRGTAFSRMVDFGKMADWLIFQSEWAKDYVGWWFKQNGIDVENKSNVIYNGVNSNYFYEAKQTNKIRENRYLYVQFNRDENKRFPEACYLFHQEFRKNKSAELILVGQFSPEVERYKFDFFAGEYVDYQGIIENQEHMGNLMRTCKYILFPAYADASPNTLLEAISCDCKPIGINPVGGSIEVLKLKGRTISQMANEYKEIFNQVLQK
jgi:hypothetical protein